MYQNEEEANKKKNENINRNTKEKYNRKFKIKKLIFYRKEATTKNI